MSTNFYFEPNIHPFKSHPIKPFKSLHIGKRSCGWEFSFKAHIVMRGLTQTDRDYSQNPDFLASHCILQIRSWADWKALLQNCPGTIYDEYKRPYSLSEFMQIISGLSPGCKSVTGLPLLNHYDMFVKNPGMFEVDASKDWKDSEGFSFTLPEFS